MYSKCILQIERDVNQSPEIKTFNNHTVQSKNMHVFDMKIKLQVVYVTSINLCDDDTQETNSSRCDQSVVLNYTSRISNYYRNYNFIFIWNNRLIMLMVVTLSWAIILLFTKPVYDFSHKNKIQSYIYLMKPYYL